MRPERGLVAGAALEAPDGSFVVRRLVWSKRDDGSSTLIGVPLNVDGTRCEAPRDAEGFSDAFCRCAAVAALGHTIWMGLILKELLGYNST